MAILRRTPVALWAVLMLVGMPFARADITGVSATPSSANVAIDRPTPVTVVWRLTTTSCLAGVQTFSSNNATLNFGSTSIAIGSPMTTSYPNNNSVPAFTTFTETVLVPNDVVLRATRANATLRLNRVFNQSPQCTQSTNNTNVTLNVTSSSAATFGISRMALMFDGGAPVRVIERGQPLRANAEINFNGNGLFRGTWELAGPTSTAGNPTFRPIGGVQQYLMGGDTQRLESPALPTDMTGLYLLRLRVSDPTISFDTPVIRYFVSDANTRSQIPALPLGLVSPPNRVMLAPDTLFAWEPIPGARAYQLELYAKPRTPGDTLPDLGGSDPNATPPVLPVTPAITGMVVAGNQTRIGLSATARSHLVPGRSYLWRVLAVGKDGNVVGESPVREMRVP